MDQSLIWTALVVLFAVFVLIPMTVSAFLRNVEAGTIRLVSWLTGRTYIYRGPGKSKEVPLFTTGTTISSKAINVDLDITDQTADLNDDGVPQPIKVRVLASAIVSVGDSDAMIKTAANRFFPKPQEEQINILIDLLSSSGRRAINLLTHDQLFSAKTAPRLSPAAQTALAQREDAARVALVQTPAPASPLEEDDDPLAIIIRKACSRELTDLGLTFNSLNIKVVQSEVAEARRRQSAAEAQANSDIVAAQQARRAKDAALEAERNISDKQRELEQTRASNAALVAQAEAIRITTVATATAESIRKVNEAIQQGGEAYFRYKQIEMLPDVAPFIADALSKARLVTISGGGESAAESTTNSITGVIQTVLAAQLVSRAGLGGGDGDAEQKAIPVGRIVGEE